MQYNNAIIVVQWWHKEENGQNWSRRLQEEGMIELSLTGKVEFLSCKQAERTVCLMSEDMKSYLLGEAEVD